MTNQLATTNETANVAKLQHRVAALYASIQREHGVDKLLAPIDPAFRKELQNRKTELHSKLRPISLATAEQTKVQVAVLTLLGLYLNVRITDKEGTSRAFMAALNDQPMFAVMEALDDFRNGRVFDVGADGQRIHYTLDHAPSAPRLLDQVKKRAADVQEERGKIARLLAIEKIAEPEVSAAERDRVAEQLRRLADSLLMKRAHERQGEREKIRAEAQEARDRAERIQAEALRRNEEADWASQEQAAQ